MNITSLVTGGAGFIGSHVAKELIKLGHNVIVLDDLSGGNKDNVPTEANLYVGSICNEKLINSLFKKYLFTYVYHLAAYAAEGLSHFIRRFNYNNNLIGSINLINASVNYNVKCFVFTSSIAVYGENELPLKEEQYPQPEDPYGIAKYAVEQDLKNAKQLFGLDSIIFRPHNVYGPHQNIGDKYRNVVGIFMNQLLQNKALTIFGDGEQSRAFTYIDDVAPYIANAVNIKEAYNQTFNIGDDTVYTVKQLAEEVSECFNSQTNIQYLEKRDEVEHAYSCHKKFEQVFQPQPYISLKNGLEKMADWVKEHGARTSNSFENIEIEKNLPPSWRN
ncbi:NAD-dependent epimerase/dehydratase family protein [Pseudofulvibacter geojedonensis]|uniref:NAD-dependent epimerase/dehydratase family protein n=1 Tax=Pseudofulvibacter geojedonensis TaxID=1123758 RepID=A0ABW3I5E6_9FLAO